MRGKKDFVGLVCSRSIGDLEAREIGVINQPGKKHDAYNLSIRFFPSSLGSQKNHISAGDGNRGSLETVYTKYPDEDNQYL